MTLNDKIAGKVMNYIYAIFLLYSGFLIINNDETDNFDKLKIYIYMIIFNPLYAFLSLINKAFTIIAISILFYLKYFIYIDN